MKENGKQEVLNPAETGLAQDKKSAVSAILERIPEFDGQPEEKGYVRLPDVGEIASLGVAFQSVKSLFGAIAGMTGKEGIYKVSFPSRLSGGNLLQFADGKAFMGAISSGGQTIAGQARLTPVPFDPTALFMAVALMAVQQKLNAIQKKQEELLDYLKDQEKAKKRGDLETLQCILRDFRASWNSAGFRKTQSGVVSDIRRSAVQAIHLQSTQIQNKIQKTGFLHLNAQTRNKINAVKAEFYEYKLALYLYAFATFLQVLLTENYGKEYLDNQAADVRGKVEKCRCLYQKCIEVVTKDNQSSVETWALAAASKGTERIGGWLSKIPKLKDSKVPQSFLSVSTRAEETKVKRNTQTLDSFEDEYSACALPFADCIQTVNRIYNSTVELLLQDDRVYAYIG